MNYYNDSITTQVRLCPRCHSEMSLQGELWRCNEHGLFFSYGPRLLVRAIQEKPKTAPLLPWQTMNDRREA